MEQMDIPDALHGQRTLAAIVFSDVVSFSARMGRDEEHTLKLVRRDLDIMKGLCETHEGQVLKTTGDGLLAGLQILAVMRRQDRPMSEFGRAFRPLPQRLRNCRLNGGLPLEDPKVRECIRAAEARLDGRGRILVRPSGTEPLIRVMVEADDEALLQGVLDEVAGTIERYA